MRKARNYLFYLENSGAPNEMNNQDSLRIYSRLISK